MSAPTCENSPTTLTTRIKKLEKDITSVRKARYLLAANYIQATAAREQQIAKQELKLNTHVIKLDALKRARRGNTDQVILRIRIITLGTRRFLRKLMIEKKYAYRVCKKQNDKYTRRLEARRGELDVLKMLHTLSETTRKYRAVHEGFF